MAIHHLTYEQYLQEKKEHAIKLAYTVWGYSVGVQCGGYSVGVYTVWGYSVGVYTVWGYSVGGTVWGYSNGEYNIILTVSLRASTRLC